MKFDEVPHRVSHAGCPVLAFGIVVLKVYRRLDTYFHLCQVSLFQRLDPVNNARGFIVVRMKSDLGDTGLYLLVGTRLPMCLSRIYVTG